MKKLSKLISLFMTVLMLSICLLQGFSCSAVLVNAESKQEISSPGSVKIRGKSKHYSKEDIARVNKSIAKTVTKKKTAENVNSDGSEEEPQFEFEGNGTFESPFLIKNETDLRRMSDLINNYATAEYYATAVYLVTNDIHMTKSKPFTPIGEMSSAFGGFFEGNGKSIYGLNIKIKNELYVGLFGVSVGIIDNITMRDSTFHMTVDTKMTEDNYFYLGSVVGYNAFTNDGFVGIVASSHNVGCKVFGNFVRSGKKDTGSLSVGGICGVNRSIIGYCYNSGNVSLKVDFPTQIVMGAGGICGMDFGGSIVGCCNVGKVYCKATEKADWADLSSGGILGMSIGYAIDGLSSCMNKGEIIVKHRAKHGHASAGGIAGQIDHTYKEPSWKKYFVKDVYNKGKITSIKRKKAYTRTFAGGIVGILSHVGLKNSYNTGKIKANFDAGAIIGQYNFDKKKKRIMKGCFYKKGTAKRGIAEDDVYINKTKQSGTYKKTAKQMKKKKTYKKFFSFKKEYWLFEKANYPMLDLVDMPDFQGIKVVSKPRKLVYKKNQKISTKGLVVKTKNLQKRSKKVTGYTLSYDTSKKGKVKVKVTYKKKNAYFYVTVK